VTIQEILNAKGSGVVSIIQSETVQAAAKLLRDKKFGSLLVRDRQGRLAGIITERDIIRGIGEHGPVALTFKVEELMTQHVKTCRASDAIRDVVELMSSRRIRHVPVVNEQGDAVGMISSTDIIRHRLGEKSSEVEVLRELSRARA